MFNKQLYFNVAKICKEFRFIKIGAKLCNESVNDVSEEEISPKYLSRSKLLEIQVANFQFFYVEIGSGGKTEGFYV